MVHGLTPFVRITHGARGAIRDSPNVRRKHRQKILFLLSLGASCFRCAISNNKHVSHGASWCHGQKSGPPTRRESDNSVNKLLKSDDYHQLKAAVKRAVKRLGGSIEAANLLGVSSRKIVERWYSIHTEHDDRSAPLNAVLDIDAHLVAHGSGPIIASALAHYHGFRLVPLDDDDDDEDCDDVVEFSEERAAPADLKTEANKANAKLKIAIERAQQAARELQSVLHDY